MISVKFIFKTKRNYGQSTVRKLSVILDFNP